MHAYRRFFATHAEESGMNPAAMKKLLGHSRGTDVTARYARASEKLEFLRSEMERCGLGFGIPQGVGRK